MKNNLNWVWYRIVRLLLLGMFGIAPFSGICSITGVVRAKSLQEKPAVNIFPIEFSGRTRNEPSGVVAAILILAILLISAAMRLPGIRQPLDDAFGWREASTAMMAENLPDNHWNPFFPEVSWTGNQPGYQGRELQTLTYGAAALNVLFGTKDWHGRVVAVILGLLTTFAIYGLISSLKGTLEGLIGALIYAISPGAVMVDRSYLPDPAMVCLLTIALWGLSRGLQRSNKVSLGIAAVLGVLAVLAKPVAVVCLPAAIYLIVRLPTPEERPRCVRLFALWLCIAAATASAYFAWAIHISRTYPPYHLAGDWGTAWTSQLTDSFYLYHFQIIATGWLWTPLLLFLALIGAIAPMAATSQSDYEPSLAPFFFHFWLLSGILLYFGMSKELVSNPWNMHVVDPAIAAFAGRGLMVATALKWSRTSHFTDVWRAAVVVLPLVVGSKSNIAAMKWGFNYSIDRQMGEALSGLSRPSDLVIVSGTFAGNPLAIYYSRRRGWIFPPPLASSGYTIWLPPQQENV